MRTLLACCLLLPTALSAGEWPGFLGAGASPIEADSLPLTWSPGENVAWTQTLPGYGQSSPIVVDQNVYLTTVAGPNKETLHVVCLDLATGKVQWDYKADATFTQKNSVYVSRAAPTPVADTNGVYAYFEGGDIFALTPKGELRWRASLSERYGDPTGDFGLSASPVQFDDRIVILVDDPETAYLVALAKKSGEVLWKQDRTARRSWTSPAVMTIDGEPVIICSSAGSVDGYSKSGDLLFNYDKVGGNTGTTPTPVGEGRFLVAASPGRRGENAALAPKSNGVMQVTREGDTWSAAFEWTSGEPTPSWASPIAHDGVAYWINRVGVVYALDAKTGEEVYTKRIGQSAWATPIGVGNRVYVFGRDGLTTVLKSGTEHEVLAENKLWSDDEPPINNLPTAKETDPQRAGAAAMFSRPVLYGVAVADGKFVVRTGSQVFCVSQSE